MPLSPDGRNGVHVLDLDLPRTMMWGTLPDTTWLWVLEPRADGTTRLITRIRSHYRWLSPSITFSLLVEHRLGRALSDQHVSPEVAEAAVAPGAPEGGQPARH